MSVGKTLPNWKQAFVRITGVAARPIREAQGQRDVVLEPYRGYGSRSEVFLIGRVFRQSSPSPEAKHDSILHNLRDISRRIPEAPGLGIVFCSSRSGPPGELVQLPSFSISNCAR